MNLLYTLYVTIDDISPMFTVLKMHLTTAVDSFSEIVENQDWYYYTALALEARTMQSMTMKYPCKHTVMCKN